MLANCRTIIIHSSMSKDDCGWGGIRVNQNGRPKKPPELRRVKISARVDPSTKKFLDLSEDSMGKTIDRLVRKKGKG